ncbi:MAG: aspartate ammonia-lyase, partial [Deltaproteobacteria bacterium]|nr:aspartate ammonia-lyase [Deltaproteobacteria bacterium]
TLCESLQLLAAGVENFRAKCVAGIGADRRRCAELIARNLSVGTALAPLVGYDTAAKLVKQAFAEGKGLREIAERTLNLPRRALDRALDTGRLTSPGVPRKG